MQKNFQILLWFKAKQYKNLRVILLEENTQEQGDILHFTFLPSFVKPTWS